MPYIPWNSAEIITAILEIFPKAEMCVGCCVDRTLRTLLMITGRISAICSATSIDFFAVIFALFHIRTRASPANFIGIYTQVHVVPREKGEGDGSKLSVWATLLRSHCSRLASALFLTQRPLLTSSAVWSRSNSLGVRVIFGHWKGWWIAVTLNLVDSDSLGEQHGWNLVQIRLSFFEYNAHVHVSCDSSASFVPLSRKLTDLI